MFELWFISGKGSYYIGSYKDEDEYFVLAGLAAIGFSYYENGKYYKNSKQKEEFYVIIKLEEVYLSTRKTLCDYAEAMVKI